MDKLQNIRGVAFDLDGTLVDSARWVRRGGGYGAVCAGTAGRGARSA